MCQLSHLFVPIESGLFRPKDQYQAPLKNAFTMRRWPLASISRRGSEGVPGANGVPRPAVRSSRYGGRRREVFFRWCRWGTHAVIDPRDTRSTLKRLLDVHCGPRGVVGRHQLANWPTSY
jgi:hypothetical protein